MLVDSILSLVPGLQERLQAGIEVANIGCGRGHAVNLMAQAFPRSTFVGYDLSEEGTRIGRREADRMGLTNAHFEMRDATRLEMHHHLDLITAFDVIHDQAQPAKVLAEIADALRSDGLVLIAEFAASSHLHENVDFVLGPWLYAISCMHCMPVSLALKGAGLGAMWGEQHKA